MNTDALYIYSCLLSRNQADEAAPIYIFLINMAQEKEEAVSHTVALRVYVRKWHILLLFIFIGQSKSHGHV